MSHLPPPPDDPEAALNHTAGHLGLSWTEANDLVVAMTAGATSARLNRRQRWALLIVLGLLDRSRRHRQHNQQELVVTHAERKRLRKALDDMRQERDRERKRADQAELRLRRRSGRPGCGKVPLGTAPEAHRYIELRCAATGEHYSDYATYTCRDGCEITGNMAAVWHIGHIVPRAERERRAESEPIAYDAAADLLGLDDLEAST
jgi:hypothetical protein